MISVHGIFQNGVVVLDEAAQLPEGAHVRVTLDDAPDLLPGGRPWPRTPGDIAAFVEQMDATPGLEVSDEEYERIEADRLSRKAGGIAETKERMERITATLG